MNREKSLGHKISAIFFPIFLFLSRAFFPKKILSFTADIVEEKFLFPFCVCVCVAQ